MSKLLARRNNETEIRAFETICDRLAGFDDRLDWEYVDGWLTGLACGPAQPTPEEAVRLLCADTFDRVFADPADRAQALRALKTRLSVLREELDPDALLEDPHWLRLAPLIAAWDEVARAALVAEGAPPEAAEAFVTGGLWAVAACDGLRAADALAAGLGLPPAAGERLALALTPPWERPEPGETDDPDLLPLCETLDQVHALQLGPHSPHWATHVQRYHGGQTPERDALIDVALLALQELRLWWLEQLPRPQTRRVAATPGRNDPCPCGSGKKYKKCHGAG